MPWNKKDRETFIEALIVSDLVIDETSRIILCREIDFPRPDYINHPEVTKFCKRLIIDLEDRKRNESLAELARLLEEDRKGTKYATELKKIRRELEKVLEEIEQEAEQQVFREKVIEQNKNRLPEGWYTVDKDFLADERLAADSEEEFLINFFNGATPRWGEILSGKIWARKTVKKITDELKRNMATVVPCFTVLLDAGGEGKSTILKQVVCDLTLDESQNFKILYRDEFESGKLFIDFFKNRPKSGENWLIVADEAVDIAGELFEIAHWLFGKSYQGYQFFLCARDSDWIAAKLEELAVKSNAKVSSFRVDGLDEKDARGIVNSWNQFGKRGMGVLYGKSIEQAQKELIEKALKGSGFSEGSFFGAIFDLRLEGQLDVHIQNLVLRLKQYDAVHGHQLIDIYAYIIALHAEGFDILNEPILARTLGFDSKQAHFPNYPPHNEIITREIRRQLGREAAISHHGNYVLSRHRSIAIATKRYLENEGLDFNQRIIDLVVNAIELFKEAKKEGKQQFIVPDIKQWNYKVAEHFVESNPLLAIGIMRGVWDAENRSNYFILNKLTQVMRTTGQAEAASEIFRNETQRVIKDRSFYYEWSTTEALAGRHYISVWLAGVSLADDIEGAFNADRFRFVFTGLVKEFPRLAKSPEYIQALGACATLGLRLKTNPETEQRLIKSLEIARQSGYKTVNNARHLVEQLVNGILKADSENRYEDKLPAWVKSVKQLDFEQLCEFFVHLEQQKSS